MAAKRRKMHKGKAIGIWALLSLCLGVSAVSLSCSSQPTDMRTLVPADALVYLETNDLGAALQPIIDSKPFNEVAKTKPDLSALKGVQVAVAITGFETSEEKVNDEQSVGKVQPHFVAIADTHAWQFQTVRFAEQKLGSFVADIYDSEPTLEEHEKGGGHYLTWTAKDGRKAYAFVNRNLVYFGNDESSIDKCLAVARGEADSIAKGGKVAAAEPGTLASGYVSQDGVAQIANIFALKFAQDASEEPEVQSAIAGILPQILRNTITDVRWTAHWGKPGYEDAWQIGMPSEVAGVFNESMAADGQGCAASSFDWLPSDVANATCYNFKNSQVAWRSLLLMMQKRTDPSASKAIAEFSSVLFEPYGISDPDLFFAAGNNHPVTANLSADGENPVVITSFIDERKMLDSLTKELRQQQTGGIRESPDGDTAVFTVDLTFIGGDAESVKGLYPTNVQRNQPKLSSAIHQRFDPSSISVTVGRDTRTSLSLVEMLAHEGHGDTQSVSTYFTETRFTKTGIERKTTSDFGFIGWIIAQLAEE